MKTVITAVILAAVAATSAIAGANTTLSPELVTLAQTGNPDAYAAKFGGTSNHKTGGMPGDFSYTGVSETQLDMAKSALRTNEFLAPHFAMNGGDVIVMVAPHLLIDGAVVKGAGPDDNFIVVRANGSVQRRDVSNEMGLDNVESATEARNGVAQAKAEAALTVIAAAQTDTTGLNAADKENAISVTVSEIKAERIAAKAAADKKAMVIAAAQVKLDAANAALGTMQSDADRAASAKAVAVNTAIVNG